MDWQKTNTKDKWSKLTTFGNGKLINFAGWDSGLLTSDDEGITWIKHGKLKLKARKFYFFNGKEIIGHNGG